MAALKVPGDRWRIAYVISTSGGIAGAERVLLELLAGGTERSWEQLVLNPSQSSPGSELAERARPDARYVAGGAQRRIRRLATPARLQRVLAGFEADVIVAMLPAAGALVGGLPRPRGSKVRILSHQHGDHFVQTGRRAAAALDRRAGLRFDSVVACSEATAAFLRGVYRYPPELVTTIPNGWSGRPIARVGSERPTVVCVSRLRPQKGHADLIAAFSTVLGCIPTARLVLVGDGPERGAIAAQIEALGIGASVELAGTSDDVWEHLAGAEVFAVASRYEPLGIAALEAMAAGVPVVATATGGLPEVVGSGGILVPPGDPPRLAEALERVLSDPELAQTLGEAGRRLAADRTMERMVDGYFDLYEGLLSAARRR